MFFEKEILSFCILDVLKIDQKNTHTRNCGRNYNALSFRIRANTKLKTASKEYHLRKNSVAYVPARIDYDRTTTEDEMIVVHFDSTDYHTDEIECFSAQDPEKMKCLFERILTCWNQKEIGYKYKCTSIFYEILEECYVQNFKSGDQNSKIQESVAHLVKNFKDPKLTIGEVARQSFVSEVYFRKLFKEEYGISPQKYIVDLRIQHAKGLIAAGYYSLQEVAYLSGYSDYKYFSVAFKKIVGVSPSDYWYNYK